MDQALQAAGLALQQRQQAIGIADLPHLGPGRVEVFRAVPDQRRQDQHDADVEHRQRQDAPANRQRTRDAFNAVSPPAPSRDNWLGLRILFGHSHRAVSSLNGLGPTASGMRDLQQGVTSL